MYQINGQSLIHKNNYFFESILDFLVCFMNVSSGRRIGLIINRMIVGGTITKNDCKPNFFEFNNV